MPSSDRVVVDFGQHSFEYQQRGMEKGRELRAKYPVTWSESYDVRSLPPPRRGTSR